MNDIMICNQNKTIIDALKVINQNGKGIVFIVDQDQVVKGVLTDGDVRNAILKGIELSQSVEEIMNKNFIYACENETYDKILIKISDRVKIVPIVDNNFKYLDYFEFSSKVYFPVANPELIGNEFKYLTEAFLSTWISSSGKYINLFEEKFAEFCGTKFAIAVSNGTTALHLALLSLNIGEGDEVIVPDLTFAATINSVLHANAKPVIVDVEKDSWCIDPNEVERAINEKTKAIIPVHLYGQPANMHAIMKIALKYNLSVIEDAAEAHGAEFNGEKVGSIGDIGCFSFFGNKVITTGEGGMCVTNSSELERKIRQLKDHGMCKNKRYWHDIVGYNYRMTNLQASIGYGQLERIDEILLNKNMIENKYKKELNNIENITWQKNNLSKRKKITWLVSATVSNEKRDLLIKALKDSGIDARPFFYSLGDMPIYKKFLFSNKISKKLSMGGLNFPTTYSLDDLYFNKLRNVLESIL